MAEANRRINRGCHKFPHLHHSIVVSTSANLEIHLQKCKSNKVSFFSYICSQKPALTSFFVKCNKSARSFFIQCIPLLFSTLKEINLMVHFGSWRFRTHQWVRLYPCLHDCMTPFEQTPNIFNFLSHHRFTPKPDAFLKQIRQDTKWSVVCQMQWAHLVLSTFPS